MEQSLMDKLTILADSAKYDVACTSSGASRAAGAGGVGSCYAPGCCHAFTADGRCVSLLKVLMTNCCSFDCSYCVNRKSNDVPRATFTPRELAELTIEFYRRNYIEGLFLSSAVLVNPDYTTERMLAVLRLLRGEYRFGGYIHAKAIPGTSPELLEQLGFLADRLSVNIELPSERSLNLLAPDKGRHSIFRPMKQIAVEGAANREEVALYRKAPRFAPVCGSNATLTTILCTHGHYDHVGSAGVLSREWKARIYCEPADCRGSQLFPLKSADSGYQEGEKLTVDELTFTVWHTPGHTEGGVVLLCGDYLFVGDTVFQGSIGRTDLEGGSMQKMDASLRKLAGLPIPKETQLLPGHGDFSTLGEELANNFYIRSALRGGNADF